MELQFVPFIWCWNLILFINLLATGFLAEIGYKVLYIWSVESRGGEKFESRWKSKQKSPNLEVLSDGPNFDFVLDIYPDIYRKAFVHA